MKIAFFSTKSYDRDYFNKYNTDIGHNLTYFEVSLNMDTIELTRGFEGICVFVNDKLDGETISILSKLGIKLIALRCAGYNNVDIKAAHDKGIRVVRVPAYSPQAVAEHATALILTLNRKIHKAYNRVREGNFSIEKLTGFNLYQKTVGVIGTGKIGMAFCNIMIGFGCQVIAYDKYPSDEMEKKGVEFTSIDEIFHRSDIISLHCPLTPETNHMINRDAFAKMKEGVMIINTSRGALIKTTDAIDALKKGKVGHLGIDVYEEEEKLFFKDLSEFLIQDDILLRLIGFPNVIITAHQGFLTKEALTQIATVTLDNISSFEAAEPLANEVEWESGK